MNRALIIAYHRYHPHVGTGYRTMWEHWLQLLPIWASEVDALYLIDSYFGFTAEDEARIKKYIPNTKIIVPESLGKHHWALFKEIIPQVKEENMLFLDNDVVITEPGVIDGWFKMIENGETGAEFIGSFDSSGGMQDLIRQEYPQMQLLGNRMGSYYFILTKKLLEKIGDYTFEPNYFDPGVIIPELDNYVTKEGDWLDSFGWFTLKMLKAEAKMMAITDPRQSIYLQWEDGNSSDPYMNHDMGDWVVRKDPENPNNLGYYHIRNGNLANYCLTSKMVGDDVGLSRELQTKREVLRSLAWLDYMDEKTGRKMILEIHDLLRHAGVPLEKFSEYMTAFKAYHELN